MRPIVPQMRGARVTPPARNDGAMTAALRRLASTSNTSMGGIQLPSTVQDPSRTLARGRGKNGARFVDSGLSIEGRRWASLRYGTCETSSDSEKRDASGAIPAGENVIAAE